MPNPETTPDCRKPWRYDSGLCYWPNCGCKPIECPYTLATDPTAQTEPLTEGQKIVSDWERNLIGEPRELARSIDMALIEAWERGREGV